MGLRLAPDGFDARFSALSRRCSYRISDGHRSRDPLRRRDVDQHRWNLHWYREDSLEVLLPVDEGRERASFVAEQLAITNGRGDGFAVAPTRLPQ